MATQNPPIGSALDHFKLLCDYIKFHLGLYLATPPVFAVIAKALGQKVIASPYFLSGFAVLVGLCFVSGVCASWFMGRHLNRSWETGESVDWDADASNLRRRFLHHYLYWFGLVAALAGLIAAAITAPAPT
ncbi:hypothetical protein GGD63_006318 [Bradyrhizobium sp. cir1]|uniref:hypothetical protein n=1 Tax=Bradyrhizobium sp. cir1 TaxID=1445730 RepID=UPI001606B9DB|nr:hypothetical protein [Bradyrhizobium sp. cir1]MBB4373495.1 hypothetical protein [Bradyrhizobium sp. cir1]